MLVPAALFAALSGCSDLATSPADSSQDTNCVVPQSQLFDTGIGRDGIPALTDPPMVDPDAPEAGYVRGDERVAGLVVDGTPMAFPHKLLSHHEAVNLNMGSRRLVLTFCPLTGSAVVFDREVVGGREFGVSQLLLRSNLVLFDRAEEGGGMESVWSQMGTMALCGSRAGEALQLHPVMDMPLDSWITLHPDMRVASENTGFSRRYHRDLWEEYNQPLNTDTGSGVDQVDPRRAPKERVLGIPDDQGGGVAFPLFALDSAATALAIHEDVAGDPVVVFWDGDLQATFAHRPFIDGNALEFEGRNGRIVDVATGSVWEVDGQAVDGPLAGRTLEPVPEAFMAFWFAWPEFQPEMRIRSPD